MNVQYCILKFPKTAHDYAYCGFAWTEDGKTVTTNLMESYTEAREALEKAASSKKWVLKWFDGAHLIYPM